MVPLQTEIYTATTIALIAAILAIYVSVLKKNGWIGKAPISNQPSSKLQKMLETQENSAKNQTAQPLKPPFPQAMKTQKMLKKRRLRRIRKSGCW